MRLFVKDRQIDIDLQPIILSSLILGWSLYYYFSTVSVPEDGPKSALFIRPLVIGILICFPFVIRSAIKIKPAAVDTKSSEEEISTTDRGFLDDRRIFFVVALATYALAMTFLGYLIPSGLFLFSVLYYLGSRNLWILIVLPMGCAILLSVVFRFLLTVPVPILPAW